MQTKFRPHAATKSFPVEKFTAVRKFECKKN